MTIKKVNIPIKPKSKPRGQIGKYGNITHSMGGYMEWQQQFFYHLTVAKFEIPDNLYALIYHFLMVKQGGNPPDLDNLIGGVNDVLVKYEYLKDDNWKIVSKQFAFATLSDKPGISIYTCQSRKELVYIINTFCC